MNSIGRNKAWRIAKEAARKMGLNVSKARPHELYLFAQLTVGDNQYTLDLKHEEQVKIFKAAEGLRDRNSFIAVGMSMGLVAVEVSGGSEIITGVAPIFWPDPTVFSEATAGLAEYKALESVYWGRHTLKTNEGVRIDKRPNMIFRTVQQTQHSANTRNMQNDVEVKELGAAIRFGGGDQNEIIIDIDCPDKTNLAGNATRNNYIMVQLTGAVIKGSTTKTYISN